MSSGPAIPQHRRDPSEPPIMIAHTLQRESPPRIQLLAGTAVVGTVGEPAALPEPGLISRELPLALGQVPIDHGVDSGHAVPPARRLRRDSVAQAIDPSL